MNPNSATGHGDGRNDQHKRPKIVRKRVRFSKAQQVGSHASPSSTEINHPYDSVDLVVSRGGTSCIDSGIGPGHIERGGGHGFSLAGPVLVPQGTSGTIIEPKTLVKPRESSDESCNLNHCVHIVVSEPINRSGRDGQESTGSSRAPRDERIDSGTD